MLGSRPPNAVPAVQHYAPQVVYVPYPREVVVVYHQAPESGWKVLFGVASAIGTLVTAAVTLLNASSHWGPARARDACAAAETHWRTVETRGTRPAYQEHLERFPSCAFASAASDFIILLDRKARELALQEVERQRQQHELERLRLERDAEARRIQVERERAEAQRALEETRQTREAMRLQRLADAEDARQRRESEAEARRAEMEQRLAERRRAQEEWRRRRETEADALRADAEARRGWIGVNFSQVDDGDMSGLRGHARIVTVEHNSPASRAGLQSGDVVIAMNGWEVTADQFVRQIGEQNPETLITLCVLRDGYTLLVEFAVGRRPSHEGSQVSASQPRSYPRIGLKLESTNDGVSVVSVDPDSAAERSGIRPRDLVLRIGDREVEQPEHVTAALADAYTAGKKVVLLFTASNNTKLFRTVRF